MESSIGLIKPLRKLWKIKRVKEWPKGLKAWIWPEKAKESQIPRVKFFFRFVSSPENPTRGRKDQFEEAMLKEKNKK